VPPNGPKPAPPTLRKFGPVVDGSALDHIAANRVGFAGPLARGEPALDAEVAVAALTTGDNSLTERECEAIRVAPEVSNFRHANGRPAGGAEVGRPPDVALQSGCETVNVY
jgi:hypothetical protein